MNLSLFIAKRYFLSNGKKNFINVISILSLVGVAFSTAALIIVLSVFNGLNAPQVRPIPWLVPGFLARGAGTILFGQPGVSKTAHTAILCASLWKGSDFGVFSITEQKFRTLYVDLDGGWDWTAPLFRAAFRGVGLEGLPDTFF